MIRCLGHLEIMEEDRMPKKDLHSRTGRDEKKGKTQGKMERGSRIYKLGKDKLVRSPTENRGG